LAPAVPLRGQHPQPRVAQLCVRRKNMPRYRVIIHGRNFRLNLQGQWEKMGFYTPRLADAPDAVLAEHTALEEFRQSSKYRDLIDETLNSDDDPPRLCGEDVEEVLPGTGDGEGTVGFAFYRESDDEKVERDAAPNSRPPSQLPSSPEVQSSDSQRTSSSGGCG
jgi:hypothetical protein